MVWCCSGCSVRDGCQTEACLRGWQSHLCLCLCVPSAGCRAVPKQAYEELTKKLRELDALNGISGLLGWDELVSHPKHTLLTHAQQTCSRNLPWQ